MTITNDQAMKKIEQLELIVERISGFYPGAKETLEMINGTGPMGKVDIITSRLPILATLDYETLTNEKRVDRFISFLKDHEDKPFTEQFRALIEMDKKGW